MNGKGKWNENESKNNERNNGRKKRPIKMARNIG